MRNTISCILFSIFIIVLFLAIEKNIRNKMYAYNIGQFYNEPKNIDIFFIGSSRIYYPMSPMYIWNKYGVTS